MELKKVVAASLALVLLVQVGCAGGRRELTREDLTSPDPAKTYEVVTRDGTTYTFVSLHLEGNQILGTVRFTETTPVREGAEIRQTISNRYEEVRIPWNDVERVEAIGEGRRTGGGVLLAGLSVAVGIAAFLLFTRDSTTPPTGGGGGK